MASKKPRTLILDIETSEMLNYGWGIRKQYISHEDIKEDWNVISWAAKWLGDPVIFQEDNRKSQDFRDDKKLLKGIWKLLDEADLVITQNGESFDLKKLNARFIIKDFERRPSTYQSFDTLKHSRKVFGFTSHKLDYVSKALKLKYQKLKHHSFPGKTLWRECEKGNPKAWEAMAQYNEWDVLATEEYYKKIRPWVPDFNFKAWNGGELVCSCGSRAFAKNGSRPYKGGLHQRLHCKECGTEHRGVKI